MRYWQFQLIVWCGLSAGLNSPAFAAGTDASTTELGKLVGQWKSGRLAKVVISFEVRENGGASLEAKGRAFTLAYCNLNARTVEPRQVKGQWLFELSGLFLRQKPTAHSFRYRFERDELVLVVSEGPLVGEHRLKREKK
jgi:hypothetical protein